MSRCCHRSIPGSGESPCSTKSSLPSGLRTRRISRNAANGSAIEQSVQVIKTVSTVLFAKGIAVADPCRNSAGHRPRPRVGEQTGRRVNPEYDLDLLAIARKVQSRSDPNFKHPPISSGNHLAAILLELVLPHDQIEDRWQYPAVIEIHDGLFASH